MRHPPHGIQRGILFQKKAKAQLKQKSRSKKTRENKKKQNRRKTFHCWFTFVFLHQQKKSRELTKIQSNKLKRQIEGGGGTQRTIAPDHGARAKREGEESRAVEGSSLLPLPQRGLRRPLPTQAGRWEPSLGSGTPGSAAPCLPNNHRPAASFLPAGHPEKGAGTGRCFCLSSLGRLETPGASA